MKIAYFPCGDRNTASSRMRVFRIADALKQQGHEVSINGDPFAADVAVFQKRFDLVGLMHECQQHGVRVVLDIDDYIPNAPAELADITTVDTPAKLKLYPGATIIPDTLDIEPDSPHKMVHAHELKRAVWVGNSENVYHLRDALIALREHDIALTVITDLPKVDWQKYPGVTGVQWSLDTVDAEMVRHDLFIAPLILENGEWSSEWVASKSANRLYKAWCLGLPCAGTPIASFVEARLQYDATTVPEWLGVLEALRGLPARVIDATRGSIRAQAFAAECVAEQWLQVFTS